MRVALVNMPFAAAHRPSIGLTQLATVARERFDGSIEVSLDYLNQRFAAFLGLDLYQDIAHGRYFRIGLGDWIFRTLAFPHCEDNTDAYFGRYFPRTDAEATRFKAVLLDKRDALGPFLEEVIEDSGVLNADVVGFTSNFCQNTATFAAARILKARNPDILVLVGGANSEAPMGQAIADNADAVDFTFQGPATQSFVTFLDHVAAGNLRRAAATPGVVAGGRHRSLRPLVTGVDSGPAAPRSLDDVVELDYDSFLDDFERTLPEAGQPSLLFETARGCWWGERQHCTFCGLNGETMAYTSMGSTQAVRYIQGLIDRYASRSSSFECTDSILAKHYIGEVLPYLNVPDGASLFFECKAQLSDDDIAALARARVLTIQPGVESLSTKTLRLMRKGSNAFQNVQLLMRCRRHGVAPMWNLLVGSPGEPASVYEQYLRDLPKLVHLPPPTGAFQISFDRYSPYQMDPEEYGLDLAPCAFYPLTYPWDEDAIADVAYFFDDGRLDAAYLADLAPWITPLNEAVAKWQQRWVDPKRLPMLSFRADGDAGVVLDSRAGELSVHLLDELNVEILLALDEPASSIRLTSRLAGWDPNEVRDGIEYLKALGLVFSEGDHHLSLVCDMARMPVS